MSGGVGRMSLAPIEPGTTTPTTLQPPLSQPASVTAPTTAQTQTNLTTGTRPNPLIPSTTTNTTTPSWTKPSATTNSSWTTPSATNNAWTTPSSAATPAWTTPSGSSNIVVPQTQTNQSWNTNRTQLTLPTSTNFAVPQSTATNFIDPSTTVPWQTSLPQKLAVIPRPIAMSDENVMVKDVEETHSHDAISIEVRPLLEVVEDIFSFSHLTNQQGILTGKSEVERNRRGFNNIPDELSHTIERISCEIAQIQCGRGGDGHGAALPLFKMLAMYTWDAKLVLTLAAFALSYGEFWLLAQTYLSNPLAKSMAILKKVPILIERSSGPGPKQRYDAIGRVIKAMLDVTRLIVEFYDLPTMYISSDQPSRAAVMAMIPTAAYRCIRGVITCVAQIIHLSSSQDYGYSSMGWDPLHNVAQSIESILSYLQKEMDVLRRIIADKWEDKTFEAIVHIVYGMVHVDNMKVLSALIPAKDPEPLLEVATKRPASLEYLKHKNVLLLISDLDMSVDELSVLEQIYHDSKQHAYEVVWIPVVDPSLQNSETTLRKFNNLQSSMLWYSLRHPTMIDRPVIRFLKEIWGFHVKPTMVVLDTQGKVLSTNAIPMMLIWGSTAFPFTSQKEKELWRGETWKLELLIDGIEPTVLEWIRDKKYIFLYGGEDIKWIREFTTEARKVSAATGIQIEMVYAGNSHGREKMRNVMNIINRDKLSHCWTEAMVWFFWTRLESMLLSRLQIDKEISSVVPRTSNAANFIPGMHGEWASADDDSMVQEIKKLISFGRGGGWAVFAQGSQVLSLTHLTTVVHVLQRFKEWEMDVPTKGFPTAFWGPLKEHHDELRPCSRLEFPSSVGIVPEGMKCPDCRRLMEKHITFLCCHEDPTSVSLMDQKI
ncbi:protein SIEVE ELEMENT OCCLUSION B-like isoform X2 [Impatiens glandulifera]|uniref:protein SIEVE ELEMENT OCCLUSION B-like isoform X2 n=1 Tax=Impatiens glandulifera TaxID=253017 RepID=UPI001FB0A4E5|nr:protein SIEVE ELEMENT OCCLUSION B-like isoform X2 [Impatiens glandulifera]